MEPPEDNTKILTFYTEKSGIASIVCPTCGLTKEVDAVKSNIARKKIRATCQKCKKSFQFIIEIRTIYRKSVRLTGQCQHMRTNQREVIQINDLSMNGIGFTHPCPIDLSIGDTLKVAFRLDDRRNSKIQLRVKITRIDNHSIGAEFVGSRYEPSLGFYLQS
ncbi:MAG: hypothetical protein DSY90_15515 [Deltaproteobacteria bacterium]|nr:MAG: hypothetical protein DSY90_15515 [Deltaproteobacteria bacterium]